MFARNTKLLFLALLNATAYHYAYVAFLHEIFGYADFRYEQTSGSYLVWTYLVTSLPIIAVRKSQSPSSIGATLIYVFNYVPIQLTLTFMAANKNAPLAFTQAILMLSMIVLFRSSSGRPLPDQKTINYKALTQLNRFTVPIYLLTALGLLLVYSEYHSVMRVASFEDVYDLRTQASGIAVWAITDYLAVWISAVFGPFYIARALFLGRRIDWVVGILCFLTIYLAFGSKGALMTTLFMLFLKYLQKYHGEFSIRLLLAVSTFVLFAALFIPHEGVWGWINSIFLLRVFGSSGWTAAVYYEYFSSHAFTFYTHIGPVNALLGGYPYGENSLGQEIAKHYFSNEANFNAGFWASDGFAAMGTAGIPVVTVLLGLFMRLLDRLAFHFPAQFINFWLLGFWMVLMNAPFTTALLSGGGLFIAMLLWLARPARHPKVSRRGVDSGGNNFNNAEQMV
jgi:hypothetical protein